ncbi:MAG: lipoprotein signal peptidase [Bacteroidales bacterium]|nr:lipoprotein signal peptidase [Bacteroidales bacterium]
MNKAQKKLSLILAILCVALIIIDQIIKVLVKTNMSLGQCIPVIGDWFKLLFIENEGMAFGMAFGGKVGKFLLTFFRIILVGLILWWMSILMKREQKVPTGVFVGLTLILAGAIGNVIDCLFYGIIWDYAPLMFGKVVDMFYFPLIDIVLPSWLPIWGGQRFTFFDPVFNFADSCVCVGAFYLIIFHFKFFSQE